MLHNEMMNILLRASSLKKTTSSGTQICLATEGEKKENPNNLVLTYSLKYLCICVFYCCSEAH